MGYKPKISLVECSIVCINKKTKKTKTIDLKRQVLALDENNNIPTDKLKAKCISRIWSQEKITGKLQDFNVEIINIKIISEHGRVNYAFNEFKD